MAQLGCWGSLVFSVSQETIETFDKISWKVTQAYATHDRHMKKDIIENLGPQPDEISFTMMFSVNYGINPYEEVERLNKLVRDGTIERLVLGGKIYGSYKWVVTSVSNEMKYYDNKGNCLKATANVTMKEYAKR